MVIHILLSLLDVVTAFVLFSHTTISWFSAEVVLFHAILTMLKGGIFALHDFASRIDIAVGIYMIMTAFDIFSHTTITVLAVIWLSQKMLFVIGGFIAKIFF